MNSADENSGLNLIQAQRFADGAHGLRGTVEDRLSGGGALLHVAEKRPQVPQRRRIPGEPSRAFSSCMASTASEDAHPYS